MLLPGCAWWCCTLLEEFLLLPSLVLATAAAALAAWPCGRLRRCLRLRLRLSLLRLGRALLAGFVLAAAPAAPMPLRLSLADGRDGPQIRSGAGSILSSCVYFLALCLSDALRS